jgi:hypothetical protein
MKSRANTEDPAAYRLEELTVTIVSMVDSPAIGREFLLMKRQEEDTVAKEKHDPEVPEPEATAEEHPEEPEATEPEATETVSKAEEPEAEAAAPEATPEAAPAAVEPPAPVEPLTVAGAVGFLAEHMSELPRSGQVAVAMLDRQKQAQEKTDFNTAYAAQAAEDDIWTCLWVLMDVIDNVLESDVDPKLPLVLAAVQAFGIKVTEVLGGAGVKSTEPVKVKLGDVEVEVADEFQAEVLRGMGELAEQLAALKEGQEQPTEKRDGEEEAVQSEEAPVTAGQVMKMIREGIAQAKRPIYKSIAVDAEDTREEKPKRKSRSDRPGDTYSPGLAGMQRR